MPEATAARPALVPSRIVRQTSLLTVAYLATTALLTTLWGRAIPWWPAIVTAHVALCVALMSLRRRTPLARPLSVALDWHPLALFPILYKEVQVLAAAVGDWRLTAVVSATEERLFYGQPSIYLSNRLSVVVLSEYLHFCYVAYLLLIPGVAAYWYLTKRRAAFHELMLLLAIVMLGSYLVFILWPVDSPFYRFDRLGPPLAGHVFFDVVHSFHHEAAPAAGLSQRARLGSPGTLAGGVPLPAPSRDPAHADDCRIDGGHGVLSLSLRAGHYRWCSARIRCRWRVLRLPGRLSRRRGSDLEEVKMGASGRHPSPA